MDSSLNNWDIVTAGNLSLRSWIESFFWHLITKLIPIFVNVIFSIISSYVFWTTIFIMFFENLKQIFLVFYLMIKSSFLCIYNLLKDFVWPFFREFFELRKKNQFKNETEQSKTFIFDNKNIYIEKKNPNFEKVDANQIDINNNILPKTIIVKDEYFKYRYVKKGILDTKIYYHCSTNRNCLKNCYLRIRKNIDKIDLFVSIKEHTH
jgi:hypothetical protein